MKIRDIMTRNVACLKQDDTLEQAARLMKEHDVGSIPVCNQNMIVGIVTDRDIAVRTVAESQDPRSITVKDIMTENPITGTVDMDVHDAAKIMSDMQIRRLPVVEKNNLVGIVALGDISLEPTLQDNAEMTLKNISKPNQTF